MTDPDPTFHWTSRIVSLGLFLVFLVEFGEFVLGKLWHALNGAWTVLAPLFS